MRAWAEEKEQLLEDIRRLEEEHGTDLSRADLASQSAEQRIKRLKSEVRSLVMVVMVVCATVTECLPWLRGNADCGAA